MNGHQRGVSLIELLVAMIIGLFIVGGAFAVYLGSRDSFRVNESVARIQEEARFGLMILSDDLALAGFLGRNNMPFVTSGRKGDAATLPTLGNPGHSRRDCVDYWYIDIVVPVTGANNTNPYHDMCLDNSEHVDGTDVLVVRHAAAHADYGWEAGATVPLQDNRQKGTLYIRSDLTRNALYRQGVDTDPSGFIAPYTDREWLTHLYYIEPPATNDEGNPAGPPTLRRLRLQRRNELPALRAEEVLSNVEDFQVQFGQDDDLDGRIDRWINPGDVAESQLRAVAVRFWLLIRAENEDPSLSQDVTYKYADVERTVTDGYRRQLVEQTVELRNARAN